MEKTNKKLKKHIIENDVNSILIFKISHDNNMIRHTFEFNKKYSNGKTIYFGKGLNNVLINQIRYFCLKDLANIILFENKIEKLSKEQIKLFKIIYGRLNYIGINKIYYVIKDINNISYIKRLEYSIGLI